MAGKVLRLGKVANELNVGHATIVEFLATKGVSIDANPNTKIEEGAYDLLLSQFAADQSVKEKSKQVAQVKEKRETITLNPTAINEQKSVEAEVIPEKETPAPVVETPKVKVEEKAPVEKIEESTPVETTGPKVVGKIDLDSLDTKTRPDKKKKSTEKEKVVEATKKPVEKENKPAPVAKEPEISVKKEDVPEKPAEPVREEIETIKTVTQKLTGPVVVGKIELPVEKPKTKSIVDKKNDDAKRKRKRIKKVNNEKQAPAAPRDPSTRPIVTLSKDYKGGSNNAVGGSRGGKKRVDINRPQATEQDIQKEIKETLARLSGSGKSKASKNRRAKRDDRATRREQEAMEAELDQGVLKLSEFVSVSELASMMNVQSTQVISACMSLGIFVSINQRLDAETIQIVADEFGFEAEFVSAELQEAIPIVEDKEEDLIERPPIVTVMGHVDHGKTSLLDNIRKADVTKGEAGGITQHIGAYSVTLDGGKQITFLDTPGHEAFTAMRARGAQVTDIAIIIVAADDDVMPQTKEAISHAQAAGVPMIFAINKIDKDGANPDKIREQLSAMNILVEEWGGKYQCQEISAKKGLNIDKLLEKILLEAEMLNLKANPNKDAVGTVIESSLDKGKG